MKLEPKVHDNRNGLDYVLMDHYDLPALRLPEDKRPIAQCEENECHFKVGFSAGLLVQQEAVEQVKKINDK